MLAPETPQPLVKHSNTESFSLLIHCQPFFFLKISEYDQEMPQSHTTEQPMDHEEESKNDNSNMTFRTQQK